MKSFIYDTIIDAENICNLKHEIKLLKNAAKSNKKVVVYGPRNYGKTSVVQSVIIPYFQKIHKESFIFSADLMEVKNQSALNHRMQKAFERSFASSFPKKNLLEIAKRFILNLRPKIEIDPITSLPSLSIDSDSKKSETFWQDILNSINNKISKEIPTLTILDEFQDIAFIEGAQGMFRQVLQNVKEMPIIILGSKRHILSQIFAVPSAPLANFGEDIEFFPIEYGVYHQYMEERFAQRKLTISFEDSKKLQDLMLRVPEAINIICAHLFNRLENCEIDWENIIDSLLDVLAGRRSRYEQLLSYYSISEQDVLIALQKNSPILQPSSKDFLKQVNVSASGVQKIIKSFYDSSLINKKEGGYIISDPLLAHYVSRYR